MPELGNDYTYRLTRVCLREGHMTLPRTLMEIFPSQGDVTLEDSESGERIVVHMEDARTVTGLTEFYRRYRLQVNDKLLLHQREDGTLGITSVRKARQADYSSPESLKRVLDYIADNHTPLSEAEIRDIFPDLPIGLELANVLKADGRFVRREGRWRLASEQPSPREPLPIKIDDEVIANPFPFAEEERPASQRIAEQDGRPPIIKGSEWRKQHQPAPQPEHDETTRNATPGTQVRLDPELGIPLNSLTQSDTHADGSAVHQAHTTLPTTDSSTPQKPQEPQDTEPAHMDGTMHSFRLEPADIANFTNPSHSAEMHSSHAEPFPAASAEPSAPPTKTSAVPTTATTDVTHQTDVTNEADVLTDIIFPGDAGLEVRTEGTLPQDLSQRVMWALSQVGLRIHPLPPSPSLANDGTQSAVLGEPQQCLAEAPLGKRGYTVLIHLHPSHARLDWGGLLAKRRETEASYLCVFGDKEDLQRLHAPAELAGATLWSWQGLEKLESCSQALALSPLDVETYFASQGMLDEGLEHFSQATEQRISERGHLSTVLRRLANLDAPCTFSLEDLQHDASQPDAHPSIGRTTLRNILNTLSAPPFDVVMQLDDADTNSGTDSIYSLRQPVVQMLSGLSDYAQALKRHISRHAPTPLAEAAVPTSADEASLNV